MYTISNATEGQTTTYAYASVSDSWVAEHLKGGSDGGAINSTGKVRSFNMFPTCDRVTILPDGKGKFSVAAVAVVVPVPVPVAVAVAVAVAVCMSVFAMDAFALNFI